MELGIGLAVVMLLLVVVVMAIVELEDRVAAIEKRLEAHGVVTFAEHGEGGK